MKVFWFHYPSLSSLYQERHTARKDLKPERNLSLFPLLSLSPYLSPLPSPCRLAEEAGQGRLPLPSRIPSARRLRLRLRLR